MKWSKIILVLAVILTVLMPTVALADAFTLYENWTTTPDSSTELYLSNWFAQTFTVGYTRHTLAYVTLNLSGEGTTGNLYVGIYATNSSGYPDGLALSTGSKTGSELVVSTTSGDMYKITMTDITLEANTKYAIVCYGTGASNANCIHWYMDGSAGGYTGGSEFASTNSGTTWAADTDDDYMFQVWGVSADSTINDVKVFESYMETDDWLITMMYTINGSCDNFAYQWYAQLIDNSDSSVAGCWSVKQCEMKPIGLYKSATEASSEVWGGNYSVKIFGYYGAIPNASYTLTSDDWLGDDLSYLDSWVKEQAQIMEDYDGVDYITTVPPPYYEVLTMDGGSIFDVGIPYLSFYRPDIFQFTTHTFPLGYEETTGTTDYADALYNNWDVTLGPEVSGVLTDAAPYFGFTSGRMVGALLTLMGFLSLAVIEKSVAFMVILGGVMIGVFPMATVVMLVFIMAVILIRSLFWSST